MIVILAKNILRNVTGFGTAHLVIIIAANVPAKKSLSFSIKIVRNSFHENKMILLKTIALVLIVGIIVFVGVSQIIMILQKENNSCPKK